MGPSGMSPVVHGLLAWLLACLVCNRRLDRRLVVIAGVAADLDGVFVLFSSDLYITYHHTFGHTFVLGLPIALAAASLGASHWRVGLAALAAFGLHLVADIVGSSWPVQPLYPLSAWSVSADPFLSPATIYLAINPVVAAMAFALTAWVMYRSEISPFEVVSLRLDRFAVFAWIFPLKHRCACGNRAIARCTRCLRVSCARHLRSFWRSRCAVCRSGPANTAA